MPSRVKSLAVIGAPLLPVGLHVLYQPLNWGFTVRWLGCGCKAGFNANSFNLLFYYALLVASVIVLAWLGMTLKGWRRYAYLAAGVILQTFTTFALYHLSLWR